MIHPAGALPPDVLEWRIPPACSPFNPGQVRPRARFNARKFSVNTSAAAFYVAPRRVAAPPLMPFSGQTISARAAARSVPAVAAATMASTSRDRVERRVSNVHPRHVHGSQPCSGEPEQHGLPVAPKLLVRLQHRPEGWRALKKKPILPPLVGRAVNHGGGRASVCPAGPLTALWLPLFTVAESQPQAKSQ